MNTALLAIILFVIGILWFRNPINNYYTRVATYELIFALISGIILAFVLFLISGDSKVHID